jgi:dTDP-glucose 4,6-dehydratase
MRQALRGEDLTVFGDGRQTRSFCYVDDLMEGLYKLLYSGEVYPVNLGNPQEMTVLDLAERIAALCGGEKRIVFKNLPVDDPKVRRPDITKAKHILRWEPTVPLDEGLRKVFDYFKGKAA